MTIKTYKSFASCSSAARMTLKHQRGIAAVADEHYEVVEQDDGSFIWIDLTEDAVEAAGAENDPDDVVAEADAVPVVDETPPEPEPAPVSAPAVPGFDDSLIASIMAHADAKAAEAAAESPTKGKGRPRALEAVWAAVEAGEMPPRHEVQSTANAYTQKGFDLIRDLGTDIDGSVGHRWLAVRDARDAIKGKNTYARQQRGYADAWLAYLEKLDPVLCAAVAESGDADAALAALVASDAA